MLSKTIRTHRPNRMNRTIIRLLGATCQVLALRGGIRQNRSIRRKQFSDLGLSFSVLFSSNYTTMHLEKIMARFLGHLNLAWSIPSTVSFKSCPYPSPLGDLASSSEK